MHSQSTTYRSFCSNSLFHVSRYGRAFLVQLPCWEHPFVIGPHWYAVLFTVLVILGGSWMNFNALLAAEKKHAHSTALITNLRTFVYCMRVITTVLLLMTATTDPGIVYSKDSRRSLRKEHARQQHQWFLPLRRIVGQPLSSGSKDDDERLSSTSLADKWSARSHLSDDDFDEHSSGCSDSEEDGEDAESLYSSSSSSSAAAAGIDSQSHRWPLNREQDTVRHWQQRNLSYCSHCLVLTPPQRHIYHCDDCGFCIEDNDHHCPWMGQCIGKRNMKWFLLFNASWIIFLGEFLYLVFALV